MNLFISGSLGNNSLPARKRGCPVNGASGGKAKPENLNGHRNRPCFLGGVCSEAFCQDNMLPLDQRYNFYAITFDRA